MFTNNQSFRFTCAATLKYLFCISLRVEDVLIKKNTGVCPIKVKIDDVSWRLFISKEKVSKSYFHLKICFVLKFTSVWCEWNSTTPSYPFEAILLSLSELLGLNGALRC